MRCRYCGQEINDTAVLCPKCGAILDEEALNGADEEQLADIAPAPPVNEKKRIPSGGPIVPAGGTGAPIKPKKPKKKVNGCAIAGFVLAFFPILNIIGLILSAVGMSKAKSLGGRGKGLAIAGLVISIVEIAIVIILLLFMLFLGGMSALGESCSQSLSSACSDMGASCGDSISDSISSSCS